MDIKAQATIDAFLKAFEDTFEGIAFAQVLARIPLEERPEPVEGEIAAMIDLTQPMNARFFLGIAAEHAMECFSSVYTGIDLADVGEEMLHDFVCELTNTAAGHFSSAAVPEKKDMVIGLPELASADQRDHCLTPGPDHLAYQLQIEEYSIHVALLPIPA